MKIILAVAFAVLLVATIAQADTVEVNGWSVIIPDGSTVTSVSYVPPGVADANPIASIDFTFADGYGTSEDAAGESDIGSFGSITFTVPVESLTFDWQGSSGYFQAVSNNGQSVGDPQSCSPDCPFESGVATFTGPITSLTWETENFGGISSIDYTLDAADPPPSSLLLLGLGLIGFFTLFRRRISLYR
jgi:hypothetical protein